MVYPNQRPTTIHPNQMYRMPTNRIYPNQRFNGPPKGNNIQNMIQRFLPARGMQQGNLPTRAAGGLSSTINNVQQVLKVVQSTAPIVQQYGPMVKNLPKMYQLMKALKDVDDDEPVATNESPVNESIDINVESTNNVNDKVDTKSNQGLSKPKLYI